MLLRDFLSPCTIMGVREKLHKFSIQIWGRSCTIFQHFYSLKAITHGFICILFALSSFFFCAREWITNNQSNESGERCDGENVKIQFTDCVCMKSRIYLPIHVKIFFSSKAGKIIWKFYATHGVEAIKIFSVCRLKVLEIKFEMRVKVYRKAHTLNYRNLSH